MNIQRVSSIPGDPGHAAYQRVHAEGKFVRIYLDGAEQNYVRIADAGEGFIECNVLDANGRFVSTGDDVQTEIRRGRVEIKAEPYPF